MTFTMLFSTLSHHFQTIDNTGSRLKMTEQLAAVFKETTAEEIDQVCYLSLGMLAPKFVGIELQLAEKMMERVMALVFSISIEAVVTIFKNTGDLGDTFESLALHYPGKVKDAGLTINQVYNQLVAIAKEAGSGSQDRKIQRMVTLLRSVDSLSGKYLVRIPVGKLRLGFSEMTIIDGLSWMETGSKSLRPVLESAFNLRADIGQIATIFKAQGVEGIKALTPQPGTPIRPAKSTPLLDPEEILEKMKGQAALEPKFDGFRVQIHVDKNRDHEEAEEALSLFQTEKEPFVKIFSRNLDDITYMFPDLVKAARSLPVNSVILDGEAVAVDPDTFKILDFQETVKRKRKHNIENVSSQLPLYAHIFDLLYLNGDSYIGEPLTQRRKQLESVLKQIQAKNLVLTEQVVASNEEEFITYFEKKAAQGMEGVMAKKLDAPYRAGARDFTWVKYKVGMQSGLADTVDVVVMGYFTGQGKWTQFGLGRVLVGVVKDDKIVSLSRVGSGFSEDKIVEMVKRSQRLKVLQKPKEYEVDESLLPDVWVQPEMVIELRADSISRSPKYLTGLSLRFPRFIRFRDDKTTSDATSLDQLKLLSKKQQ